MTADPTEIDLSRILGSIHRRREADGTETPRPTYPHHLLCDENGTYPAEMNDWEREVLQTEMKRTGFVAWTETRRATQDSLGVAYTDGGQS